MAPKGAAARRQSANAGRTLAARSGRRNQMTAAAAPSGSRNQMAAAAISRRHARNRRRRALLDASVAVDGEANRRCHMNLSARLHRHLEALSVLPNVAAADKNTIASAETDTIVDHLIKPVDIAELQREAKWLAERHEEIAGEMQRIVADFNQEKTRFRKVQEEFVSTKTKVQEVIEELEIEKAQNEAQVQMLMEELECEKAQKAAEVQKVMDENVRLHAMLDKKEAQLQAMSEQCKFMALNHNK